MVERSGQKKKKIHLEIPLFLTETNHTHTHTKMALNSISLLPIKSINISSSSIRYYKVFIPQKSSKIVCQVEKSNSNIEIKKWKAIVSTALAAAVITFSSNMAAMADLNKFEADTRGEFGIGSAAQFGSADLKLVLFFQLQPLIFLCFCDL